MSESSPQVLSELPEFPDEGRAAVWKLLRVEGLVKEPFTLTSDELNAYQKCPLTDDFRCEEGWVVPDQRWEGVTISDLLSKAGPLDGATYVAFSAGDFTVGLTLEEALSGAALLATRLNGSPLTPEHGGPCRLVAAGKHCYYNVKWVDRIELTAAEPPDSGRQIAQARSRQRTTQQ